MNASLLPRLARVGCAAVAVLAVTACASSFHTSAAPNTPMSDPFTQTSWQLAQWTMSGGASRIVPHPPTSQPLTLTFTQEAGTPRASGFAGCNRYSANYTYAQGILIVKAPVSTRMACPSEERARLEGDYLSALTRIASSTLEAQPVPRRLTVTTTNGDTLLFLRTQDPMAGSAVN